MSYIKVLAEMKSRPEDKRMLLGGGWTPEIFAEDNDEVEVSCGCALAEFVPGIVDRVKKQAKVWGYGNNAHFSSLFNCSNEKFNGMTYTEARRLEQVNDSYKCGYDFVNTEVACRDRFQLVEEYVERRVEKEVFDMVDKSVELSRVVNAAYLQKPE